MKRYTDLFIDFDDTLYDTHGNAVIALDELFDALQLGRWFADPQLFYDEYWKANIDLVLCQCWPLVMPGLEILIDT